MYKTRHKVSLNLTVSDLSVDMDGEGTTENGKWVCTHPLSLPSALLPPEKVLHQHTCSWPDGRMDDCVHYLKLNRLGLVKHKNIFSQVSIKCRLLNLNVNKVGIWMECNYQSTHIRLNISCPHIILFIHILKSLSQRMQHRTDQVRLLMLRTKGARVWFQLQYTILLRLAVSVQKGIIKD